MTREEYIDFANALKNNYTIDFDKLPEFCDMAISALSAEGEWIESKERSKHWYCSVCGGIHTDPETGKWRETFDYRYPFCPNCGADMRGE